MAGQANRSQVNMVSIEQYVYWTKCHLNKCAYAISQLNNVSIEHNLPLFDNMGPNEFTPPNEQYNIECRTTIQTTIDPSHNWSKPQWIQAIGVRVVINFYTREERSDRARWRLGPLAVGSWDLSQAIIDLNHNAHTVLFTLHLFNWLFDEFKFVQSGFCSV